jgi:hypothetical protein
MTNPVPADLEAWGAIRDKIHHAAQQVMGPLPQRDRSSPPKWSILDETDCGSYIRQSITYEADEGCETTAFICLPHIASSNQWGTGGARCGWTEWSTESQLCQ